MPFLTSGRCAEEDHNLVFNSVNPLVTFTLQTHRGGVCFTHSIHSRPSSAGIKCFSKGEDSGNQQWFIHSLWPMTDFKDTNQVVLTQIILSDYEIQ